MNIVPCEDRVLVEPLENSDTTEGGIMLPDIAKGKPQRGLVLAVGPGWLTNEGVRVPLDVAVGDEVYFPRYAGQEVHLGGEKRLILTRSEVLAKILPEPAEAPAPKRTRATAGAR